MFSSEADQDQDQNRDSTNSHVAALIGRPPGQHLWCLPLLHARIFGLGDPLVLPCVDPVQTPQLGRVLLTDQNAAGADVSMKKVFAVKELL